MTAEKAEHELSGKVRKVLAGGSVVTRCDSALVRPHMACAYGFAAAIFIMIQVSPAAAWHERGWRSWPGTYDSYETRRAVTPKRPRSSSSKGERNDTRKRSKLAEAAKGQLQIVVSINAQRLRIYSDGVKVAESPVSTGTASNPTPMGLFNIIQKNRFHRSNLYSDAPMPYMQRLTWSGIALHEGRLPGYPASHGCIRLPQAFAQELWGSTRLGVRVIIAPDEVAPLAIAHTRLAGLQRKPADPVGVVEVAEPVKVAAVGVSDAGVEEPAGVPQDGAMAEGTGAAAAKDPAYRAGPISVFISRKEGKLFVRKGFAPIYSAPVTIQDPGRPLGTHLFTALASEGDAPLRWTVISLAETLPSIPSTMRIMGSETRGRRGAREREPERASKPASASTLTATAALDRIQLSPEATELISGLISPGASLIVSDLGLGHETGTETDFIVVTREY